MRLIGTLKRRMGGIHDRPADIHVQALRGRNDQGAREDAVQVHPYRESLLCVGALMSYKIVIKYEDGFETEVRATSKDEIIGILMDKYVEIAEVGMKVVYPDKSWYESSWEVDQDA